MVYEFLADPIGNLVEACVTFFVEFIGGWLMIAVTAFAIEATKSLVHASHGTSHE